jgi:hypothetical protein
MLGDDEDCRENTRRSCPAPPETSIFATQLKF